jgi:hypothetical protein
MRIQSDRIVMRGELAVWPLTNLKTAVESIHLDRASRLGAYESHCFVTGHDFSRAANGQTRFGL